MDHPGRAALGSAQIAFHGVDGTQAEGQRISLSGGQLGTWIITYTVGQVGVRAGGGMRIWRQPHKFWLGQVKQANDATGLDYCRVETDGPCQVELSHIEQDYKTHDIAHITVLKGSLQPGQHISLYVGDTTFGAPPTDVHPTRQPNCLFRLSVDATGEGQFMPLSRDLCVHIAPGRPSRLSLLAPSSVRPNRVASR